MCIRDRANNQGAKLANGQWLILLNPDAFPYPNWLEEINKAIDKYHDCENFGCLQMLDGEPNMLDGAGDCFSIFGIAWRGGHRKPIPQNIEAVSYTHLDVYKRQILSLPIFSFIPLWV